VSLHAGVLLDRVRKLPVVIFQRRRARLALAAVPLAAFTHVLSMECSTSSASSSACRMSSAVRRTSVLLAQMAGRKRLVEANAKISLGETSAALVGPGSPAC